MNTGNDLFLAVCIIFVVLLMAVLAYAYLEREYWYNGRHTNYEYPNVHFKKIAVGVMILFAIVVLSR